MSLTQYFRLALLVPLLLPVAAWVVLQLGLFAGEQGKMVVVPFWVTMSLVYLAVGGMFYGLPYAAVVVAVWRRSLEWGVLPFGRLLLGLPFGFSVGAAAIVWLYNVLLSHDSRWPAYVGDTLTIALGVGYGQAALIAAGAWLGTRAGWIEPGAGGPGVQGQVT